MSGPADDIEDHLQSIISSFYALMIQAHDHHGASTASAMTQETTRLIDSLGALSRSARALPTHAPGDLISYIERGRNPDIYNREMVEGVVRRNQKLAGVSEAWGLMRDTLAREIAGGVPALKGEVDRVVGQGAGASDVQPKTEG